MKQIAIEGLDGSGKTSVAESLAATYHDEGLTAKVVAPYRFARDMTGEDVYPLWSTESGALHAIDVLHSVFAEQTQKAHDENVDVLIFDRHWMTSFTEIADNERLVRAWGDNHVRTAYLRVDPELAHKRATNSLKAPWTRAAEMHKYGERYEQLCRKFSRHLLGIYRNDDDVSIAAITRNIVWDMNMVR